jgi:hypothetical protein
VVGGRTQRLDPQTAAPVYRAEAKVEQGCSVSEILQAEEPGAPQLGVLNPVRVVVLVAVGAIGDGRFDILRRGLGADVVGEVVSS